MVGSNDEVIKVSPGYLETNAERRGRTGAWRLALYRKKGLALFMTPIKAAVNYRVSGL